MNQSVDFLDDPIIVNVTTLEQAKAKLRTGSHFGGRQEHSPGPKGPGLSRKDSMTFSYTTGLNSLQDWSVRPLPNYTRTQPEMPGQGKAHAHSVANTNR